MVDVVLRSCVMTPAREPKLNNPNELQAAIIGLMFGKDPGPNGIPHRALKHISKRAVSLLSRSSTRSSTPTIFPLLESGKYPAQPSSYQPISLIDTIGKLFENIFLTRILNELGECGLLHGEKFGVRPEHSTFLKLASLKE